MEELSTLEKEYFVRDKVLFEFSDYFKNNTTRPIFFSFLRESFLSEYELFWERYQKLKASQNIDDAVTLMQEIIKEHLHNDSPHLLNLSNAMQQNCLSSYNDCMEKYKSYKEEQEAMKASLPNNKRKSLIAPTTPNTPTTTVEMDAPVSPRSPTSPRKEDKLSLTDLVAVFASVERYVLMMLSEDVFPRFIRSKIFLKWYTDVTVHMKNKTEASSLLRQVCSLKTDNVRRFKAILYDQEEFTTTIGPITQKDVDFTRQLLQDEDHWEMLDAHNDGTAGYITKVPYVTSIKSRKQPTFVTVKFISYLPYDLATIAITLFEYPDKSDPNIIQSFYRGFVQDKEYPAIAGTNLLKMMKLMKNREHDQALAPFYYPETQELSMVWKTAVDPTVFPKLPKTVQIVGIGANFLKAVDANRTKLTSIMVMSAPKIMFRSFTKRLFGKIFIRRRQQIFSSLVKQCDQVVKNNELKDGFPAFYYHSDRFGMTSALEEYCNKHLKPEQYPKFVNQPNQTNLFYPDRRKQIAGEVEK